MDNKILEESGCIILENTVANIKKKKKLIPVVRHRS